MLEGEYVALPPDLTAREAIERIRSRYEHIGRKTGAPFLAVVYPAELETAVLKEWQRHLRQSIS